MIWRMVGKNPGILFTLLFMAMAAYAIVQALAWPFEVALFPLIAAGVVLVTAAIVLLGDMRRGFRGTVSDKVIGQTTDFRVGQGPDAGLMRRRAIITMLWLIGVVVGIWLVGFHLAMPLTVLLYVRFQGKESWWASAAAALVTAGLLWGVFDRELQLLFPAPHLPWFNQHFN